MSDSVLSQEKLAVINALSNGATISAAAEQAGVHRNTIAYWRRSDLTFQKTLAHAHYDRALLAREKAEELLDLAIKTLHDILADEKAPASVRLKAALAVIQTASTPPQAKKEYAMQVDMLWTDPTAQQSLNKNAQTPVAAETEHEAEAEPKTTPVAQPPAPTPTRTPSPELHNLHPAAPAPQNLHKAAQTIRRESAKVGRNEPCPCGSNLKYKRCCLDKIAQTAA
jgi:transposase-like protein